MKDFMSKIKKSDKEMTAEEAYKAGFMSGYEACTEHMALLMSSNDKTFSEPKEVN